MMKNMLLEIAKRTISIEGESIMGLGALLTDDFEKTIKLIHQSKGRLVITGIGKSAIVGQKITSTLNSTGTPSLFMHAADAIHGDLGMIQPNDVVLIISKSGESPEIKVLVPLIKNFGNILIGMVGNLDSYLAKNADCSINTTIKQEACPNNLAPTSSTTAQMVMGDVLAVCLMELNEFSGRDFAKFHPGGNLGKRLYLRAKDLIQEELKPRVLRSASLKDVIIQISEGKQGAVAVVDEIDFVWGVITDGDIRRLLEKTDEIKDIKAENIYSKVPKTINAEELAVEALKQLKNNDISQLVVVDEHNKYQGILHLHSLIREGII